MRISALCLLLPVTAAFADTVKLRSGEIVEGRILQNDANGITMEVQFSPTIKDERRIDRKDIVGSAVTSDDEAAFAAIRDLQTPDTALDPKAYADFIARNLRPFLQQYPTSTRATDVKLRVQAVEADIARIKAGDKKVGGIWYTPEAYVVEKYQFDAGTILAAIKQQFAEKNYVAAMNYFVRLQTSFPNSLAYAESLPLAPKVLAKLDQQLLFTIGNLPQTKAQRQAAVDRTPPEQRAPIQAAIDAENARADAVAQAAQRGNQKFFPILPYDEKGLLAMQQSAKQLGAQLEAIDQTKFSRGAGLVRQATKELDQNELDAAQTTLAELAETWREYEGLARLQQRLTAARAAAEKAATPTTPPTAPTPTPVSL